MDLETSVEHAKAHISGALAAMQDPGRGRGAMNPLFDLKEGFMA